MTSKTLKQIEEFIHIILNQKVILDKDLAALYEAETKALLQAVKEIPKDFMFHLSNQEVKSLRSQIVTSKGRGRIGSPLYEFTEKVLLSYQVY